jgi:hypothetical protein
MAESALSVRVTADVADLQTKLALAQAELRSASKEMRGFADQAAAAGEDSRAQFIPALEESAGKTAALKNEVAALNIKLMESRRSTEEAEVGFGELKETIESAHASFAAFSEFFLAGLGVEKVLELAEGAAELGDQLHKANEETGISVENLSGLRIAADHADLGFDQLTKGIARFNQETSKAAGGTGTAAKAFELLGINQAYLVEHGNDSAKMLETVAQRLDQWGDGANKQAIVTELFGTKLRDLQPVLDDLAKIGFAGLIDKADQAGQLFGGEFADEMRRSHDNLKDFKESIDGLGIALGANMKGVTEFAKELTAVFSSAARDTQYVDTLKEHVSELQAEIADITNDNTQHGFLYNLVHPASDLKNLQDELARVQEQITDINDLAPLKITNQNLGPWKPDAPSLGNPDDGGDDENSGTPKKIGGIHLDKDTMKVKDFQNELKTMQDGFNRFNTSIAKGNEELAAKSVASWKSFISPIGSAFDTSIKGIIAGTQNTRQALANIGNSIGLEFLHLAEQRAEDWLASELAQTSVTEAQAAARTGVATAADATQNASHFAGAIAQIEGDAAKTFASVFAWAAPTLGPFAAIPAGAAAALIIAKEALVPSAAGGWDIPAGLNPVTQLHEREMVLPAHLADIVRGGGAGSSLHIHPGAITINGAGGNASNIGDLVVKAIKDAHRKGAFV